MLTKRVSSGQRDLKKSTSIWSLKSYISSEPKIDAGRRQNVEQDLIQKELQLKINENGSIHNLFDRKLTFYYF